VVEADRHALYCDGPYLSLASVALYSRILLVSQALLLWCCCVHPSSRSLSSLPMTATLYNHDPSIFLSRPYLDIHHRHVLYSPGCLQPVSYFSFFCVLSIHAVPYFLFLPYVVLFLSSQLVFLLGSLLCFIIFNLPLLLFCPTSYPRFHPALPAFLYLTGLMLENSLSYP
jgi:hypothetical protein